MEGNKGFPSYSADGGSALVRRRIQTPFGATVRSAVQLEGEVVLGASPPARRSFALYLVMRSGAEKLFERAGFSDARRVTRKV
jgi:hypothetical protein